MAFYSNKIGGLSGEITDPTEGMKGFNSRGQNVMYDARQGKWVLPQSYTSPGGAAAINPVVSDSTGAFGDPQADAIRAQEAAQRRAALESSNRFSDPGGYGSPMPQNNNPWYGPQGPLTSGPSTGSPAGNQPPTGGTQPPTGGAEPPPPGGGKGGGKGGQVGGTPPGMPMQPPGGGKGGGYGQQPSYGGKGGGYSGGPPGYPGTNNPTYYSLGGGGYQGSHWGPQSYQPPWQNTSNSNPYATTNFARPFAQGGPVVGMAKGGSAPPSGGRMYNTVSGGGKGGAPAPGDTRRMTRTGGMGGLSLGGGKGGDPRSAPVPPSLNPYRSEFGKSPQQIQYEAMIRQRPDDAAVGRLPEMNAKPAVLSKEEADYWNDPANQAKQGLMEQLQQMKNAPQRPMGDQYQLQGPSSLYQDQIMPTRGGGSQQPGMVWGSLQPMETTSVPSYAVPQPSLRPNDARRYNRPPYRPSGGGKGGPNPPRSPGGSPGKGGYSPPRNTGWNGGRNYGTYRPPGVSGKGGS